MNDVELELLLVYLPAGIGIQHPELARAYVEGDLTLQEAAGRIADEVARDWVLEDYASYMVEEKRFSDLVEAWAFLEMERGELALVLEHALTDSAILQAINRQLGRAAA